MSDNNKFDPQHEGEDDADVGDVDDCSHDNGGNGSDDDEELVGQLGRQATRQNIKVICRIRPGNDIEANNGGFSVVKNTVDTIDLKTEDHDLHFNFDHVFGVDTTQQEMFEKCAKPLIADIFMGYNATIFAYGQTGTGKVHLWQIHFLFTHLNNCL
jgi:hypothetical protein